MLFRSGTVCEVESVLFGGKKGKFRTGLNFIEDASDPVVSGKEHNAVRTSDSANGACTLTSEDRALLRAGTALQEADFIVKHV